MKDPKVFIEYSKDPNDVYKSIEDSNQGKKRKVLTVFYDMIANIISNKKLHSLVTELFIRGVKLNISLVLIIQSYFLVPKDVRLNTRHLLSDNALYFRKNHWKKY